MPLVSKDDLNGQEPILLIDEQSPHQEHFVLAATLKYWESFDTDTDYAAEYSISQMVLSLTQHELICE